MEQGVPRLDFDVDAFLIEPRVAHVATGGPRVVPVWFLWEGGAFWWLTGPWSRLASRIGTDPSVALVVDSCDLRTGEVRQVQARGRASIEPYQRDRAYRKLSRYLGRDEAAWDRSRSALEDPTTTDTRFVRLRPDRLAALDLSFEPGGRDAS
jgi:nitroimidazol reductase NimA-like FMN-containing flavoprotein (pyridoxamine 5'-phosphate oxidase superfamily)